MDGLDGPIRAAEDDEDALGRRDEGTKPRLVEVGRDVIADWPPDPRRAVGINDVANPKYDVSPRINPPFYLLAFLIVVLTKLFFLFEQQVSLQVPCRLLAQLLLFLLVAHFDIDIVDMSIYEVEPCDSENGVYLEISTKYYGFEDCLAEESSLIT